VKFSGAPVFSREPWHHYSDSVGYLRDITELSHADKEMIFGGTIRRVLRWPTA
jgi:hypothetical protein